MSQLIKQLSLKEGREKANVFEQYLIGKAFDKGVPLIGTFELTPQCTLDCKMCYVHLQKHQMHKPELTTREWISLIDRACDMGMLYATLTGGECLLYPGFWQIYEHLQSKGILVTVFTNATLLDESAIRRMTQKRPKRIQISVYGSCAEGYNAVTGCKEAFNKVDKAIDLLLQAEIPLLLSVTVSKQLLPDLKAILQYCESKKQGITRINSLLFDARPDTEREFQSYALSCEEQHQVIKIRQEMSGHSSVQDPDADCGDTPPIHQNTYPEKGLACTAGRFGFSIGWDGKMTPCNLFDFAAGFPLTQGFENVWRQMNEKCRNYQNPVECFKCPDSRACRKCPAEHHNKAAEGHVNPTVCAEFKRMLGES